MDIIQIKKKYLEDAKSLDLDELYVKYLGKKGEINNLIDYSKGLLNQEKIDFLKDLNVLKKYIDNEISELRTKQDQNKLNDIYKKTDLTVPSKPTVMGSLHPLTLVARQLNQFFHYYGFSVIDGPEIEDDKHNFEIMGVDKDHPARELQDTLYIMQPDVLLRTQTSSIEARELQKNTPPIRFVCPGKTYRNETANKTNGSVFTQYQGVCIDKSINMGHLKWMFSKSLKFILGEDTQIRYRAKYYPEVEPGLSPDILCKFCKGEGCDVCKNRGWIEIAGGGMIHPNTLLKTNIDPNRFSGFAFGWGLDRIAMQRYEIKDIRSLYNGSIVYD